MKFSDEILGPLERNGDCFAGVVCLRPGQFVPITVESDLSQPSERELREAIESAKSIFRRLTPQLESRIRAQVAEEVIEAVYSQSEKVAAPDEAERLAEEMSLEGLDFFPGSALFIWSAKKSFPDHSITAQINSDLEIEDVMVQD